MCGGCHCHSIRPWGFRPFGGCRPHHFGFRPHCGGGSFAHGLAAGLLGGRFGCCGSERAAWGALTGGLIAGLTGLGFGCGASYNAGYNHGFFDGAFFG